MRNMLRLTDFEAKEIFDIFKIADSLRQGKYKNILKGKSIIMFFPETSIRTRVTFEKGIYLLGGQSVLFPVETLDKKEALQDVCGYLNNWANMIIVRHKNIKVIEELAKYSKVPVINAMCDINHPCEVIADMYALSKCRKDFTCDNYLFCGERGNIGLAWQEAAEVMGFKLVQCCPEGDEIEGLTVINDLRTAVKGMDIICSDSVPARRLDDFKKFEITQEIMKMANDCAVFNPCPPFYRSEGVSSDVIESDFFVGYEFKKCLLEVQQAIMIYCLTN